MMDLQISLREPRELEAIVEHLRRLLAFPSHLLDRAAERAEAELAARLPRRKGHLIASLSSTRSGDAVLVGLKAKYAKFLEFGTRPHEIEARRARALAFEMNGRLMFARRVLHPGIRPRFMVRSAAQALLSILPELSREEWKDVAP